MSSRLASAIAVNLFFVNAVVFFFELAARTFSPSHHAVASATVTIAFVGALVVRERLEVSPIVGALVVPLGLLVVWFAFERATLPAIPVLLVAAPLVLIDARLLRWVGRAPGVGAFAALAAGVTLLAAIVVVLDRRAEPREAAWRGVERSAFLELRAERGRALRAAALV
jgi:hypothetical protein